MIQMQKFQNKYRIHSARASWWDYADPGLYFITICTANRACLFGEIIDQELYLSPYGIIVLEEWEKSFDIRAELYCDAWVIMPNHIHAILRIEQPTDMDAYDLDARPCVSMGGTGVAYRPPKSISSFVAGFKSAATKRINELRNSPRVAVWQTRFHDHIIRNEKAYHNIYNYIQTNIEQWEKDKFFPPKP